MSTIQKFILSFQASVLVRIGKNISTKAIGSSVDFHAWQVNPDREDITHLYKHPEGSQSERSCVWRASQMSTKPSIYDVDEADPVGI